MNIQQTPSHSSPSGSSGDYLAFGDHTERIAHDAVQENRNLAGVAMPALPPGSRTAQALAQVSAGWLETIETNEAASTAQLSDLAYFLSSVKDKDTRLGHRLDGVKP